MVAEKGTALEIMNEQNQARQVWVLATINEAAIAVPAEQIREMVALDSYVLQPNAGPEVRGVMNLRGRVLSLLDLRLLLGEPSALRAVDELCAMLQLRKQDHERWIATLERSLLESVPFGLARDPTQCAFGKWYYSFQSDNAVLRMQLAKLEQPHRSIHALADSTLTLSSNGRQAEALELLEHARQTTLLELLRILDATAELIRNEHREIVLVLDRTTSGVGVVVDDVAGVRQIDPTEIESVPHGVLGEIDQILLGHFQCDGRNHLLLDLERVVAR